MPTSTPSAANLCKNLFVYDNYHFPFHDAFAQFSVSFPQGRPVGPGAIFPRATQLTFQPIDVLGEVWLEENGQWMAVQRSELECYPWCAIERALFPGLEGAIGIEEHHVFIDERHLLSEFVFRNYSAKPIRLAPRWLGLVPGDRYNRKDRLKEFEPINSNPRPAFVEPVASGVRAGLAAPEGAPDLPLMAVDWRCLSHELDIWTGTEPAWSTASASRGELKEGKPLFYALGKGLSLELGPEQSVSIRFLLTTAYAWFKRPAFDWPAQPKLPATIEAAIETRKSFFLKSTVEGRPLKSALDLRVLRARTALLRDSVAGLDGEFSPHTACLCGPSASGFSTVFFWDSLFSSVALSSFDAKYARGAMQTAFARQLDRDGSSPENKYNYTIPQRFYRQSPQAPVASWAVEKYLQQHKDDGFLAEIFPKLVANHRYWEEFGDSDRDGLAEWSWSGQAADDSPLYDSIPPHSGGCDWMPPIASVSLNCFLYRDALVLADLSDRLGKTDEAARYRRRADAIFQKFMEVCYVAKDKRFWDYSHRTLSHLKVRTFYLFWPLWARMPLPRELVTDLIENELLNPKKFFGPVPFPSVAYDEPSYNPNGYWRGKAWPHITYWLLETLVHHGYEKEARQAADRFLALNSSTHGFLENNGTFPADMGGNSTADYNWGAAAYLLIAEKAYLQP